MSTIDYREFAQLSDPFIDRALRLKLSSRPDWFSFRSARRLSRGDLPIEMAEPLHFRRNEGNQPMDFLWTSYPPLRCVSNRVVSILEANEFTGWSTYPVTVYDNANQRLPDYHGFAITGSGGSFQSELSKKVTLEHPWGGTAEVYKGFFFGPTEWDGTDVFLVDGKIIVKARVQQVFMEAEVSNVKFTPLVEVEVPVSLFKA